MERVHFSGRVPLIYLEILMLRIEIEKILKQYTYIKFLPAIYQKLTFIILKFIKAFYL